MAENIGPVIVRAVGTAVSSKSKLRAQVLQEVMSRAVTETIAAAAARGAPWPSDDELRNAQLEAQAQAKLVLDEAGV